jgi:hypothetical protein
MPPHQTNDSAMLLLQQQSVPGQAITSAASTVARTVTIRRECGLAAA